MRPTKLAFDPSPILPIGDPAIDNALTEIYRSLPNALTAEIRKADLVRSLKMVGKNELAIKAADDNEIKAKVYEQMINHFERLIVDGFGFTAALYQMLEEGWLLKIDNFNLAE